MAYVASGGRWKPAKHLKLLSQKLSDLATGRIRRLIVSMPPRHGKSEFCSYWFPVWLLNTWPDRRVILASYEADFAASWGRKVRNAITEHQDVLQVRLRSDVTAANRWETVEGGGMVTAGVGGAINGRGAEMFIIDDPVKNAEEAYSETYRQRAWDWWTTTASTRLEPGSSAMVIMTRWHDDDLAGRLLKQAAEGGEQWESVVLPALAEADDPLGREPGEALWPSRYDVDDLLERQRLDSQAFAALYQQEPVTKGGGIFDETAWRSWRIEDLPRKHDALSVRGEEYAFDQVVQSWDLAQTEKASSDWTVGAVWARKGADFWCLALYRKRATFDVVLADFERLQQQWPWSMCRGKYVEAKANGQPLIDMVKRKVPGVIGINPMGDKVARANAVSPYQRAGNCWLPDSERGLPVGCSPTGPWVGEFKREHRMFPKARHDDQVDTTTQALHVLDRRTARSSTSTPEGWGLYD